MLFKKSYEAVICNFSSICFLVIICLTLGSHLPIYGLSLHQLSLMLICISKYIYVCMYLYLFPHVICWVHIMIPVCTLSLQTVWPTAAKFLLYSVAYNSFCRTDVSLVFFVQLVMFIVVVLDHLKFEPLSFRYFRDI